MSLVRSTAARGSHLAGGFAGYEDVARRVAATRAGTRVEDAANLARAASSGDGDSSSETVFHASGRLVEVHATVTNPRERYVDNLTARQFVIREGGRPVPLRAFESDTAPSSCVLLLDTTASMEASLPALKGAAVKLLGALRPGDAVAVYSLTGGISELQPFTQDKEAAARAVWRAELGEMTALYDGLVRVTHDLSSRTGKKAIVVFTDGEDNMSTLGAELAIQRAKTAGIPIYTIGQGLALHNRVLLGELGSISKATGGLAFTIQSPAEIAVVFDRVMQDLLHGYLLGFQPPPTQDRAWRGIQVELRDLPAYKIRAREGYYPE
jgi:VWFA-related protein